MTIRNGAKELFNDLGLDREDAEVVAKCIGQQMIDDSEQSGKSLTGMVYDVQTLYDEGVPDCRFETSDDQDIRFRARFHVDGSDEKVERNRVLRVDQLQDLIEQLPALNGTIAPSELADE